MAEHDDTEQPPTQPDCSEPGDAIEPGGDEPGGDIVRRHLTRAWQSWAPAPDLDARVRARLTSSSAATMGAIGLGAANGAGRPSAWAPLQATGKLGALVGAGLVGVGFLSGYLAHSSLSPNGSPRPEAPRAAVSAVAGVAGSGPDVATVESGVAATAPATVASGEAPAPPAATHEAAASTPPAANTPPTESPRGTARAATHAATPAPATPPAPDAELALLQRAERAVRADNAALALALIGELEARYPRSTLLEERRAIELLAHCRAGATDAHPRAARFLRQHPSSLYAGRIRELCPMEGDEHDDPALTKPGSAAHRSGQKEPR